MSSQLSAVLSESAGAKLATATIGGFALLFAVLPAFSPESDFWRYVDSLKYPFSVLVLLSVVILLLQYRKLVYFPRFLVAPLVLSVFGLMSFGIIQLTSPGRTSYGSGLIPLLVCAIPMFVPVDRLVVSDSRVWIRRYTLLLLVASVLHVAWQFVVIVLLRQDEFLIDHTRTFVMVFLLLIAGIGKQRLLTLLALGLIVSSTILRPSSTLAVCTAVSLLLIVTYWLRQFRLYRFAVYVSLLAIVGMNVLTVTSQPVARWIFESEPGIKEDLGGESNAEFRLGVLAALRDDIDQHSLLLGKMFTGDITPKVGDYLPWYFSDEAPIHSDFQVILSQGGLVGYALFVTIFLGLIQLCYRCRAVAWDSMQYDLVMFFDAVPAMSLIFSIYISFNPMLQDLGQSLFFLILIPLSTVLARRLFLRGHFGAGSRGMDVASGALRY